MRTWSSARMLSTSKQMDRYLIYTSTRIMTNMVVVLISMLQCLNDCS
jgi:hypothetical protein